MTKSVACIGTVEESTMTRSAPTGASLMLSSIAVPPPEVTARSWPAAVNGAAPMNWKAWLPLRA